MIWTILDNFRECSQAFRSIIAAVAEMERENIRVQTMAGREQKAREGKRNGGFAPYGYRLEMGNLLLRRMLFVTDCKYGLTETDVKHILKMKKGKKFGERKENRSE